MYKVSIFNSGVETVVHFPSSNQEDPHVNKLSLKEGLSIVDTLSFSLYPNNQGYNNIFELTTIVKVTDLRDNTIRFTGRILDVNNKMESSGVVYKEVTCEGAMSFLNDTKMRAGSIYGDTVTSFLTQMLNIHNSKVDSSKRIYIGNIDVPGNVIHTCEFKTTLAEILTAQVTVGGNIRVREVNGVLYMDWLQSFSSNTLEVSLGINMKDMIISKDVTSLGTRIIPLGANNLTIESVNGGIDYIEDTTARSIYGIIEKTVEYKDIEDAATLRTTCVNDLSQHTQPSYILSSNALDLSFLSGNKAEQFVLGVNLHLLNRFMGVDATYKVVSMDLDLLTPYNPNLTISQKPITLSNAINDLRKSSIQNNGVYNNVQIGSAYGIRAVRSDGKAITTINATEGISIENQTKKVFYVDTNGKLVCVDIQANNITANGGTYNNITANGGTFDDITATNGLTIRDGDASCAIGSEGITLTNGNYTSKMQVYSNPEGEGAGIEFDDSVIVKKALVARYLSFFQNNVEIEGTLTINGKLIGQVVSDIVKHMVKASALNDI